MGSGTILARQFEMDDNDDSKGGPTVAFLLPRLAQLPFLLQAVDNYMEGMHLMSVNDVGARRRK